MNKIKITFLLGIIVLIMLGCSNNQKYDEALADFYSSADTTFFFTAWTLDSYSSTWNKAIENRKDFNEALREEVNNSQGFIAASNIGIESMAENLKILSEGAKKNPEYEEIYEECKDLYSTLSALVEQSNSPTGSLRTFNQNVNDLAQEYNSKYKMIDTLLSDEVKEIIKQKEEEKKTEKEDQEEAETNTDSDKK